jgi:hypothetical protein
VVPAAKGEDKRGQEFDFLGAEILKFAYILSCILPTEVKYS